MSNEDPLFNSCLNPSPLTMRTSTCFYCGSECKNDRRITWTVGIRYCAQHKDWAIRDCNAYLHRTKSVNVRDAMKNPIISRVLNLLLSGISIMRSNGKIQDGWKLNVSTTIEQQYMCYVENEWTVPLCTENEALNKNVTLISFMSPLIKDANTFPEDFNEYIRTAIKVLDEGIYKEDYKEHMALASPGSSRDVPETKGVYNVQCGDKVGRLFIQ